MITTVKDAVRRTRQHHAIEHATLHLLASRLPGGAWPATATPADLPFSAMCRLTRCAAPCPMRMLHLQAGESSLAIHPNCGTNLAVTGIMATAAALAGRRLLDGGKQHVPGERFAGALLLVVPALIAAQPVGLYLQKYTTLARSATAGSSRSGPSSLPACTPIASPSTKRQHSSATVRAVIYCGLSLSQRRRIPGRPARGRAEGRLG